ncbi:MAG: hypothetical protein RLZZ293_966 [Pseudomonadota bacterium]|jgi:hypothetical protein
MERSKNTANLSQPLYHDLAICVYWELHFLAKLSSSVNAESIVAEL